jgi:hypothetical protein
MARVNKQITPDLAEAFHEAAELEMREGDIIDPEVRSPIEMKAENVNMSLHKLVQDHDFDASALETDPNAFRRISTAKIEAAPVAYSDDQLRRVRSAAQAQAALSNPEALSTLDEGSRAQLANIAQATRDVPSPDVTTSIDNQRITIPGEVLSTATSLGKRKSLHLLEQLVGEKLVYKVCKAARHSGPLFIQKPILWLSQMIAVEIEKDDADEIVAKDTTYVEERDGDKAVPQDAMSRLFTYRSAKKIGNLARYNNTSVLHVLNVLINKVCDDQFE